MFTNRITNIVFVSSVVIALILPLYYYSSLPETIPSHFNFSGKADSWMGKNNFILFNYSLVFFIISIFIGINILIKKTPNSLINLPNKDYWFTPERKEESLNTFRRFLFWTCSLTLLFITFLMDRSYSISLSNGSDLGA